MTILRRRVQSDYTVVPNEALNDERLSWAARGMLAYLLSKPDGWDVREYHLVQCSSAPRQGLDAVRRILAEIEAAGYLRRAWENGPRGQLRRVTELTDTPGVFVERAATQAAMDLPVVDPEAEPVAGSPMLEIPTSAPMLDLPISGSSDVGNSNAIVSTDSKQVLTLEQPALAYASGASAARPKPRTPTQHQLSFGAVCEVCLFDPRALNAIDTRNVSALATWAIGQGVSPEQIRECGELWYSERFPNRQRSTISPPSVSQLKTWIGTCRTRHARRAEERAAIVADDLAAEVREAPAPADADRLWRDVHAGLALRMPAATLKAWVDPVQVTSFDGETLTLLAPSTAVHSWLTQRLARELDEVLAELAPGARVVVLAPEAAVGSVAA